jgi:hypothetical protein
MLLSSTSVDGCLSNTFRRVRSSSAAPFSSVGEIVSREAYIFASREHNLHGRPFYCSVVLKSHGVLLRRQLHVRVMPGQPFSYGPFVY